MDVEELADAQQELASKLAGWAKTQGSKTREALKGVVEGRNVVLPEGHTMFDLRLLAGLLEHCDDVDVQSVCTQAGVPVKADASDLSESIQKLTEGETYESAQKSALLDELAAMAAKHNDKKEADLVKKLQDQKVKTRGKKKPELKVFAGLLDCDGATFGDVCRQVGIPNPRRPGRRPWTIWKSKGRFKWP